MGSLPQTFDESEGRGKPMANPMYGGWTAGNGSHLATVRGRPPLLRFLWPFPFPTPCEMLGCGSPKGLLGTGLCRGYGHMREMRRLAGGMGGLPGYGNMGMLDDGGVFGMDDYGRENETDGMKVVG